MFVFSSFHSLLLVILFFVQPVKCPFGWMWEFTAGSTPLDDQTKGKTQQNPACKLFHNTTKWYMHKIDSIQENETHKTLWDFKIQTDPPIQAWNSALMLINKQKKRTCYQVDFAVSTDHGVKMNESEKIDKYLDLARELKKKLWVVKVTLTSIVFAFLESASKGLEKTLEELERKNWDFSDNRTVRICKNTLKDFLRSEVTKFTLIWYVSFF